MRWDVINELLGLTTRRRFLEIGVQHGRCGRQVVAEEKHGVDPAPMRGTERVYQHLYRGTSDSYFAQTDPAPHFDVVLVDGEHHAETVLRDVDNAFANLAPDGFVVLHDCNPQSELAQRVPRAVGVWNGDCWRAMVELRKRPGLDAFVIDADEGIGIVRRARGAEPALLTTTKASTYADLAADRERLLGLVPPSRWQERLGAPLALGRLVVVCAVYGGRDVVAPAPAGTDADAFLLFTDDHPEVAGWQTVHMPRFDVSPRHAARRVKTLALDLVPDADVVVWVDGRISVQARSLRPLLRQALRGADLAGYPHPWSACAYAEARDCAELGRAPTEALSAQADAYRSAGLPDGWGLWNTMVLVRRRSPETEALGRAWWDEIQAHTVRDQVSWPYVLWRAGIRPVSLGRCVYERGVSPYFERGTHARAEAAE